MNNTIYGQNVPAAPGTQLMSDHCGTNEYHVVGGPGAGKTHDMFNKVRDTITDEYSPSDILITSFTDAAAWNAFQRTLSLDLPRENISTLHSFAYRTLGGDAKIAEVEGIGIWNRENPEYKLSCITSGDMNAALDKNYPGDHLMCEIQKYRSLKTPENSWSLQGKAFFKHWNQFKIDNDYLDFTDLIEKAYIDVDSFPGHPAVIFVDEAQDLSPLEISLIRKWAEKAKRLYLFFDTCQCIYSFKGASPVMINNVIPVEREVLLQSNRLPERILNTAKRWMQQLPDEKVELEPTQARGVGVLRKNILIKTSRPNDLYLDLISNSYVQDGKSVMILAYCTYMLQRIIGTLFENGIPYGNKYRSDKRDWNPFGKGSSNNIDRLRVFLRNDQNTYDYPRMWYAKDIKLLAETFNKDVLLKPDVEPGKSIFESLRSNMYDDNSFMRERTQTVGMDRVNFINKSFKSEEIQPEMLRVIFKSEAVDAMLNGDIDWYKDNIKQKYYSRSLDYAYKVIKRFGRKTLISEPQITVGTIHSVKGGEADVVYLFPDLSPAGRADYKQRDGKAATIRAFYVGMTRAREELVLCGSSSNNCPIKWM